MSDSLSESDEIFIHISRCDYQSLTKLLKRNPSAVRARNISLEGKEMVASPLHFACQFTNSTQILDTLLTNGAYIDEVIMCGSALCFASLLGKTEMVRHLLSRGARIGLAGPDGYNDLH